MVLIICSYPYLDPKLKDTKENYINYTKKFKKLVILQLCLTGSGYALRKTSGSAFAKDECESTSLVSSGSEFSVSDSHKFLDPDPRR